MRDQDLVGTLYISKDDLFLMDFFLWFGKFQIEVGCLRLQKKYVEDSREFKNQ
jgi:hypothetical protein